MRELIVRTLDDSRVARLLRVAYFRFSFRTTSFSPDQISSSAHTLMSTRPIGSATSLIVSSVMSVGTLADFFGQDTQIAASGRIFASAERRRAASRARLVANK